jgi:hypothetical protein
MVIVSAPQSTIEDSNDMRNFSGRGALPDTRQVGVETPANSSRPGTGSSGPTEAILLSVSVQPILQGWLTQRGQENERNTNQQSDQSANQDSSVGPTRSVRLLIKTLAISGAQEGGTEGCCNAYAAHEFAVESNCRKQHAHDEHH